MQPLATYIATIISLDREQVSRRLAAVVSSIDPGCRVRRIYEAVSEPVCGVALICCVVGGRSAVVRKDRKDWDDDDNGCKDRDDKTSCSVSVPDSHGAPLLLLTGGVLGVALLVQRRRKVTS